MRIDGEWLDAARPVMAVLTGAGAQARAVGGCVRNALIGAPVADVDLATDAVPERVIALVEAAGLRAVPTGIDHGTVTVMKDGRGYEVTTFRRDVATDGRRAVVAFATEMAEDAARRDFTMNALYCDAAGQVADPLGGLADLQARHVRFIGDPNARIREDYLRILRFFRFHAWYGDAAGGLDPEGLAACAANQEGIAGLSRERVGHEMLRMLGAPDPAPAVAAMAVSGLLAAVLPGAGAGLLTVLVHVEEVAGLPPDPVRRLAALGGEDVAEALRLSREQASRRALLRELMQSEVGPGELGYRHGAEIAVDVLALRAALGTREIEPEQAELARTAAGYTLPVTAADLMPEYEGPALGARLREIEARWIASGFALSAAELLR